MSTEVERKIVTVEQLTGMADRYHRDGVRMVHCHGCFDIVHPGHLRYLRSAKSHGEVLVVSLTGDDAIEKSDGTRPYIPQQYRAESLAALEFVDLVVIADSPTATGIIEVLRPHLYVKGREYERSSDERFLAERRAVEAAGGRVMFSSGDVVFSSTTILDNLAQRIAAEGFHDGIRLRANCQRWGVTPDSLHELVDGFEGLRVAVIGDAICDRYVFCESGDVADEAPVLSVKPRHEASYLGGAAMVAGHLRGLGASVHLLTPVADDEPSRELLDTLDQMKIEHTGLCVRKSLPIKQRYLADRQKLLKVDRGEPHPLDSATQRKLIGVTEDLSDDLDALIFADFGFGAITSSLLESLLPRVRPKIPVIAGDVSGPRRTLQSMKNVDLLTPTERELRGVAGDFEQSLPTVVAQMMETLHTPNMIVTLGERGAVLFHPRDTHPERWFSNRLRCEYLPGMSDRVEDVVGAGDALLAATTLGLASGASLPQAGYLGAVAAGVAVSRTGNLPVKHDELIRKLLSRPELIDPLRETSLSELLEKLPRPPRNSPRKSPRKLPRESSRNSPGNSPQKVARKVLRFQGQEVGGVDERPVDPVVEINSGTQPPTSTIQKM